MFSELSVPLIDVGLETSPHAVRRLNAQKGSRHGSIFRPHEVICTTLPSRAQVPLWLKRSGELHSTASATVQAKGRRPFDF